MKDRYYLPLLFLICSDCLVVAASFLLAFWLRFHTVVAQWMPPSLQEDISYYVPIALLTGLLTVLVFDRIGLYDRRVGLDRRVWSGSLILAIIITYIFVMAILFNYRGYLYSRLTVAMAMPISVLNIILVHHALKRVQFLMIQRGIVFLKTLLVGPTDRCMEVLQKLQEHHGSQYQVLGFVTTGNTVPAEDAMPCFGTVKDLHRTLKAIPFDDVILAMPPEDPKPILSVMSICREQNVSYRLVPELYDFLCQRLTLEEFERFPTVMLGESPLAGFGSALKRSMDLLISGLALVISSPLMFMISFLIKLDSKGPIFYVQERVGSDGQKFMIYKFRSMIDQAEKDTGPKWATANDPRTTRIGRFLRRYNLDELPQFLNVFRGEMSLVGPRPERPYFVNKFKEEIPLYMRRHMVKSGITGLAQVYGWRGDTSVTERTNYDLYYVKNWSFLLDLKIILRTLISFKNAY